jgi:cell division protein ZapA (FtsZ GTPase activity inhibitor)
VNELEVERKLRDQSRMATLLLLACRDNLIGPVLASLTALNCCFQLFKLQSFIRDLRFGLNGLLAE